MYIKCFARLRSILRRIESSGDAVTDANFNEWRNELKAAVEACYANPLPSAGAFDCAGARPNLRCTAEPATTAVQTMQRKVRRAAIDEMCRPAMILVKSGKKDANAKALAGLRTCAETIAAGIIRVWADPTDDAAATSGAAGKLRMLAYAFELAHPVTVMLRLAEAVDPAHHLHLEFGAFHAAERVVSHEGSSRYQQAFDHHRPVPVRALIVAFSTRVTGPPPIQTVFVNEQLVDAYWADWKEAAEAAGGDDAEISAAAPMLQTVRFAKVQGQVRSWSIVVSCDHIVGVDADVDIQPQVLAPAVGSISGSTRNVAEVLLAPGGLTVAPLLRDVITASLRHFHGGASQERFLFAVQQAAADSGSAQVYVGAARGAAKTCHFSHAGAKVHIVEAADTGAPPADVTSVVRRSKRGLAVYMRAAAVHAVILVILKRLLRGVAFVAASAAAIAAFFYATRHVLPFRQLILGAPIQPKTHRRTAGATRRVIALLAHTIVRSSATPPDAMTAALRKDLVTALKHRRVPIARGLTADVPSALNKIMAAARKVGDLKPDALAAMGVAATFDGEDAAAVQARGAVAGLFYTLTPGLAQSLLPGGFVKEIVAACRGAPASAAAACDILLRQASLLAPMELMQAASRCDAAGSLMLPPETLAHDFAGLRTFVFATDRSGVVSTISPEEARTVASTLFVAAL